MEDSSRQISMMIRYRNGYTVEAVLLSRAHDTMRVAVRGGSDGLELRKINGRWVSEDCEPVDVEFAWLPLQDQPVVSINDCICPPNTLPSCSICSSRAKTTPQLLRQSTTPASRTPLLYTTTSSKSSGCCQGFNLPTSSRPHSTRLLS